MYYSEYLNLKTDLERGYKTYENYERSLQKLINKIIVDVQQKNIEGDSKKAIEIINNVKNIKVPSGIQKRFDNILLNESEIAERKIVLKSKVRRLYCAVTSFCNIKCIMCDIEKHKWELPERAIEEIIGLMPYLENVMWQGGEVFFYKHFEKLMDSANLNKVNQEIVTNGLLLNEKNINKLVDYNVDLGISIDGLTKDVYEYIRAGANFDKLIENMALLRKIKSQNTKKKSHLRLNVLVMKKNIDQIEFFPEFAIEYGFTRLCVNPFGPDFISQENIFHYNKNDEFKFKIIDIKEKLSEKCKKMNIELVDSLPNYEIANDLPPKHENITKEDIKNEVQNVAKNLLLCHAPWRKLFIDSNGTIVPECLCNREHPIGNISTDKIDEIWNNKNMQIYRKKIIDNSPQEICKSDCVEGRIPEKVLKDVINTNLFWWEF
ncbi:MAG: radical SAM protein [Endomicrobiaceae bacterium]|nr:radical SAM protein [Endomicrobiaceae bacterium]